MNSRFLFLQGGIKTPCSMIKIAVFASGNGSNAERIVHYLREHSGTAEVALILTNNPEAKVIERSGKLGIDCIVFNREDLNRNNRVMEILERYGISYIILAGFLWLVPDPVLAAFPDRILNIHPALLPKYGGKGMYGSKVHEAVIRAGEKESGITIHLVNARYDEGRILFQAHTPVEPTDTPEDLAARIHALEYEYFPKVILDHISKKDRDEKITT
jgi:phosphoribosylglycinamide formyltransferase 1